MKLKYIFVFIICLLIQRISFSQNFWSHLPGPYSGYIKDIAINSSGQIIIAYGDAQSNGGIYRSTNNGSTWVQTYINYPANTVVLNPEIIIFLEDLQVLLLYILLMVE